MRWERTWTSPTGGTCRCSNCSAYPRTTGRQRGGAARFADQTARSSAPTAARTTSGPTPAARLCPMAVARRWIEEILDPYGNVMKLSKHSYQVWVVLIHQFTTFPTVPARASCTGISR